MRILNNIYIKFYNRKGLFFKEQPFFYKKETLTGNFYEEKIIYFKIPDTNQPD